MERIKVTRTRYDGGLVIPDGVEEMTASFEMIMGLAKVLRTDLREGPDGVSFTIHYGPDVYDYFTLSR